MKSDIFEKMVNTAFLDSVQCRMSTNISVEPAASVFNVEEFAVILQDHILRWRWFRTPYNKPVQHKLIISYTLSVN